MMGNCTVFDFRTRRNWFPSLIGIVTLGERRETGVGRWGCLDVKSERRARMREREKVRGKEFRKEDCEWK